MNSSNSSFPLDAAWRIDRERLLSLIARPVRDWPIDIVDETGSTNADLMAKLKDMPRTAPASAASISPFVRVAYLQTAGRGRRGRAWIAQPGNALLFSTACVLPRPPEGLAGLSLAVGTGVLEALNQLPLSASARLALKWPNDILLDDGKLAGILIETAWHTAKASAVVIGIGINLKGATELAAQLDHDHSRDAAQGPAPGNVPASLSRAWPTRSPPCSTRSMPRSPVLPQTVSVRSGKRGWRRTRMPGAKSCCWNTVWKWRAAWLQVSTTTASCRSIPPTACVRP
jgi:BirA family transcriptional regulator, biotin operon repressor / biotin---[acetyl-CoA-carboxylase] ligase